MDWAGAIELNRNTLIAIVAAIFRMLRMEDDDAPERLPRHLHRRAFRLLRPAESAARRVIVMAAKGLAVTPAPTLRPRVRSTGARPSGGMTKGPQQQQQCAPRLAFQLHDPRKNFTPRRSEKRRPFVMPRITFLDCDPSDPRVPFMRLPPQPVAGRTPEPEAEDDGFITARPLCRRLLALKAALADVPGQAQRLVRWRARRERDQARRPQFVTPLRPGLPPGYRKKPLHEVDAVLIECHGLALDAMRFNTS